MSQSLIRPPPELAVLGLRAMKMVGAADGALLPAARRLMLAAERTFLGVDVPVDDLAPIEPGELARAFPEPLRAQIVRAMAVMSLVAGRPTPARAAVVDRFARALSVDEPALRTIELLGEKHVLLAKLDYLRRSTLREMAATEIAEHGVLQGIARLLGTRGLHEDALVAAPFVALGDLPDGTFGRAYFDHCRSNGFALPGERHGFPEAGAYHDLTHVLSGYGTDPFGELQVGAFCAGFRSRDGLTMAMLPLLVFVADVNVTPIPHELAADLFERPGVAERYILAYERGARVRVDLTDCWDFWPLLPRPLDAVRRELGVPPLELPPGVA